jgi:hypothetical protein
VTKFIIGYYDLCESWQVLLRIITTATTTTVATEIATTPEMSNCSYSWPRRF